MDNSTPVLTPILALLRSRKFIVALIAFLTSLFFNAFPQFEAFREMLTALIVALALALIGGIAYEDAAKSGKEEAAKPYETPEKDGRDLVNVVMDELLTPENDSNV